MHNLINSLVFVLAIFLIAIQQNQYNKFLWQGHLGLALAMLVCFCGLSFSLGSLLGEVIRLRDQNHDYYSDDDRS